MPVQTIKNRQLDKVGLNTELHPVEVPNNGFTDGLNIRFESGAVRTRDADIATMTGNESVLKITPPLALTSLGTDWYYATEDRLWNYGSSKVHVDISRLEKEIIMLGANNTDPFISGIATIDTLAGHYHFSFLLGGTYEGFAGDIEIGSVFTGKSGIKATVDAIVDSSRIAVTTNSGVEADVRKDFENPATFEGEPSEISSYPPSSYWEFAQYGSSVVACNSSLSSPQIKIPLQTDDALTTNFIDMPQWGVENVANDPNGIKYQWSTPVIRAYKDFLICIGMTEEASDIHAGGEYPQRVRWSSSALPGQPPSSWNAATLETNAGWNDLSGISGNLVEGAPYRDDLILFTEKEVILMKFVGGASIFEFRTIFDDGGILARNCAVEFKGKHFVVGPNDVYVHDTATKKSIATNKVKQRLYDEIGNTSTINVRVHHEELREEIWVLYSSYALGSNYYPLDRAAIYNYFNETWSFMTLTNATDIVQGINPESNTESSFTWDQAFSEGILGDDVKLPWTGRETGFGNQSTVYSSLDGGFFFADYSQVTAPFEHLPRFVERVGLDVGGSEMDTWEHINRILPLFSTEGRVLFEISGSDNQYDVVDFDGEDVLRLVYDPKESYKIDFRKTYRYLAYKITFLDPVTYSLHALDFDTIERSRR